MAGQGRGWVTAEYSMLPGSTSPRKKPAWSRDKLDGRTTEIQRLIGRSLRAVIDLDVPWASVRTGCRLRRAGCRRRHVHRSVSRVRSSPWSMGWLRSTPQPARSVRCTSVAAISVGIVAGKLLSGPRLSCEDVDARSRHERSHDRLRRSSSKSGEPAKKRRSSEAHQHVSCSPLPAAASSG